MNKLKTGGFTIIELVVVIVIIGILAAVALPRFLGLQDKAHDAVVEGTQTALASGVVMAHSLWLTHGRETALDNIMEKSGVSTDFCATGGQLGLDANITGYPEGCEEDAAGAKTDSTNSTNVVDANSDCGEIFAYLLSGQSVTAEYANQASGTANFQGGSNVGTFTEFRAANPNNKEFFAEFVVDADAGTTGAQPGCTYKYAPDLGPGDAIRTITYNSVNGRVTIDNLTEATFSAGT